LAQLTIICEIWKFRGEVEWQVFEKFRCLRKLWCLDIVSVVSRKTIQLSWRHWNRKVRCHWRTCCNRYRRKCLTVPRTMQTKLPPIKRLNFFAYC